MAHLSGIRRSRQHLFGWGHAAAGEADDSIGADPVNRALHDQAVGVVERRHLLALVHQEREGEAEFPAEFDVAARASAQWSRSWQSCLVQPGVSSPG